MRVDEAEELHVWCFHAGDKIVIMLMSQVH